MPVHDWTKVRAGTFHHFHHTWITYLCASLNHGVLPSRYFALAEQVASKPIPDLLALDFGQIEGPGDDRGGVGVIEHPPKSQIVAMADIDVYARKANRIAIRHVDGDLVAVMEIVSPGNKSSKHAIGSFLEKSLAFLAEGIHLVAIDLLPPGKRDPQGIHGRIWDELQDEPFLFPRGKDRTTVSYLVDQEVTAYVEPLAVGDPLPELPLFLSPTIYVRLPLEATYLKAWDDLPLPYRRKLEATAS